MEKGLTCAFLQRSGLSPYRWRLWLTAREVVGEEAGAFSNISGPIQSERTTPWR